MTRRAQAGLTLASLLVSMALAAMLALALATLYPQQRRAAQLESELARMRDGARFIDAVLQREIALAGLLGDAIGPVPAPRAVGIDCAAGHWALDSRHMLDAVNDASASPLLSAAGVALGCLGPVSGASGVLPGSDVLVLKRSASQPTLDDGLWAAGINRAEDTQWYLRERDAGARRDWVYLDRGGRFPAAATVPGSGTSYHEYYARLFYLRSWSVVEGDGVPSFCVEQLAGNRMVSECLVQGVEQLQLEFGIDTDGDGIVNRFTDRPSASQLPAVVRVEYHLLLRSLQPLLDGALATSFQLGGKRLDVAPDGHYRMLLSGVAAPRNLALRPAP